MLLPRFIIFVFLALPTLLFSQQKDYQFSRLDVQAGLSNNQINCIYKDAIGFMWFGTLSGLNRYDGYNIRNFKHDEADTSTLSDDYINKVFGGPGNRIWIKTQSGYNVYDPLTDRISRHPEKWLQSAGLPMEGLVTILQSKKIFYFVYANKGIYAYEEGRITPVMSGYGNTGTESAITGAALDSKHYIWIVRYDGMIEKYDGEQQKNLLRSSIFQKQHLQVQFGFEMFIDKEDELWFYQRNTLSGLFRFNPGRNQMQHYSREEGEPTLAHNAINGITQDDNGLIWIATDHGGVNILDKFRQTITRLVHAENDNKSVADNVLNTAYKDDQGIIWLGTNKRGISYYDENRNIFPLFHRSGPGNTSLPFDDVNAFAEDRKGNLWIGTNGGGLIYYDRAKNEYTQYQHNPKNDNSLVNDVVVALFIDHQEKLWIGTYLGGLDCYDGKTFTHYRHNDADPASIADDRAFCIFEDSNLNLWIGTNNNGLDRFDREKKIFYHYNPTVPQTLHSQNVTSLMEDSRGNLWIGTSWGIDVLDKSTSRFIHYFDGNSKLSYYNVNGITEDHAGNIWIATNRGLNVMPKGKNDFISFFVKDGLPDNTVLDIVEDENHNLWISTKGGLARAEVIQPEGENIRIRCVNYNENDGLQGREFNRFAAFKTRNGELIFGGANGFNLFRPENIRDKILQPPVVLTKFSLFNKEVRVGDEINKHPILNNSIFATKEIRLRHYENDISFEFAALDFTNTAKTSYAYMLEGFKNDWIYVNGNARSATYTNLDPGTYIFHAKASNTDGTWNDKEIRLEITILPPFWKTPLAYLLYFLLTASLLYFARYWIIRREKNRHLLAAERKESQRMHELDLMKIKFFTNVSHEFRTPISLILIPIQKLIAQTQQVELKNQFTLIQRNAKRLLNMVNQLLDFRKMEVNELKLHLTEADIVQFIHEVSFSFTDLADKKNIQFNYFSHIDQLNMSFDQDKIERILFNLLSNAFKFTPEDGTVSVELNQLEKENSQWLEIQVEDSGIGIEPEKQHRIFDRFFQISAPEHILNQGSGIGLSITREFVEMHGGSIQVKSELHEGSCFTVLLPVKPIEEEPAALPKQPEESHSLQTYNHALAGSEVRTEMGRHVLNFKKPTILLVEDNDDFMFYLKDNLKEHFNIIEAGNGRDAWKKTLSAHPDLIVSDISMPVMNGIELCKKVKTDSRTRHISVILLTALAGEQQQLLALETGPNDYITKPFNFEILLSKIRNLLDYQLAVKETYQKQLSVSPSDVETALPEGEFMKNLLEIIEENMSNEEFSVEFLRKKLLLSRTGMYKRILALTGKTPIEFIRHIRLKRAAQLLEKSAHNVTEIAYMTGFNNPKYFARYFKEEYGLLPSAYQTFMKNKSKLN
ncbi:two-component regulator propeller domain-containing protein [Pollutibacter soli]|uniref:two-component regulator propeller domain-containing protein n=1 Tax=Pollutibacter soli TaxID=3034157 RepID=UPI0030133364